MAPRGCRLVTFRSIQLLVSDQELAIRAQAEQARGKDAYQPTQPRDRKISNALKIYASHVTSADKGAVRETLG